MVKSIEFKKAAQLAIQNIVKHGDTDIFPFPFENHSFFDEGNLIVSLVEEYNQNFEDYLSRFPPINVSSLTPVSYSGFRWATQIDPMWNAYFLAVVIAISDKIEADRIPKYKNAVFSYRYEPNRKTGDLFDLNFSWFQFMKHSRELAENYPYVVACDISEFYPRLGHHRLENALKQTAGDTPYPKRIMGFLKNFSNTNSFGLPIGGPASRILSELTINQIDKLLEFHAIKFTRFADDYHLFASSREQAYQYLIFLSEKLFVNQGLALQKSKTRIMTSAEFKMTDPTKDADIDQLIEGEVSSEKPTHSRGQLLRFSFKFDPYSPTAEKDYERLKNELSQFDIMGLLQAELAKSQIHTAFSRRVIHAIRYLDSPTKNDAVASILKNLDILYPIFSSVLIMLDQVYEELELDTQKKINAEIRSLIARNSHILRVDVHMSYAVRVMAHTNIPENHILLQKLYDERRSELIRRDIILVMARWGEWTWISDIRNRFKTLSAPERRAFIVASYILKDEGDHWRAHIKKELNPFEKFILSWAGRKAGKGKWNIPL